MRKLLGILLLSCACAFGQSINMDTQIKGSRWPAAGVESGSGNAFAVATFAALGPSLRTTSRIEFISTHANTGAATLAINGGSAIPIKKNVSTALASGDIPNGAVVIVLYDGTNFQCVTCGGGGGSGTVTSVGFTVNGGSSSGIFAITGCPITTSGTCDLGISGTSGGIPYFSTGSVLSSSAALTNHALVVGGGAGTAPSVVSSLGTTTTVLHGNASGNPSFSSVGNSDLANPSTTVNGQTCTLGSTCTIPGSGGGSGFGPCAVSASSYTGTILGESSLVNYWKLDESAGASTVADSKGSNTGTVNGTITFGAKGCIGSAAALFDGSTGYISVSRSIQDDFTIEFWMRATNSSIGGCAYYLGEGLVNAEVAGVANDFGTSYSGCGVSTTGVVNAGTGNPDQNIFTAHIGDGRWHLINFTRIKSTRVLTLYVDGLLSLSNSGSSSNASLTAPTAINIGRILTGGGFYNGLMQHVALYNAALTASQVYSHWVAGGGF